MLQLSVYNCNRLSSTNSYIYNSLSIPNSLRIKENTLKVITHRPICPQLISSHLATYRKFVFHCRTPKRFNRSSNAINTKTSLDQSEFFLLYFKKNEDGLTQARFYAILCRMNIKLPLYSKCINCGTRKSITLCPRMMTTTRRIMFYNEKCILDSCYLVRSCGVWGWAIHEQALRHIFTCGAECWQDTNQPIHRQDRLEWGDER